MIKGCSYNPPDVYKALPPAQHIGLDRTDLFVVVGDSYVILNSGAVGLDSVARRQEQARVKSVDSKARVLRNCIKRD